VSRDTLLCERHARVLPHALAGRLAAVPAPRRIIDAAPTDEILTDLEVVASALEVIEAREHHPRGRNSWRLRLDRLRLAQSIAAADPERAHQATQQELIPDARIPARDWGPYASEKGGAR
jgi:hypothetical protein